MAEVEQVIPIAVIDQKLAELERQAQMIEAERKWLLSLKRMAVSVPGAATIAVGPPSVNGIAQSQLFPPSVAHAENGDRPGAVEAVLDYVNGKRGHGVRIEDIADALESRIHTSSDNPRRIVVNTVSNLVHRKRLLRDEQGLIYAL